MEEQTHSSSQVSLHLSEAPTVNEARSEAYDLIVIGAHREGGWQRFLLDDLAHQIILHTTQPLLIIT